MRYYKFISLLNKKTKENGCEKCTYEVTDAVMRALSDVILEVLLEDDCEDISIPRFIKFKTRDAQIRPLPSGEMVEAHKKIDIKFSDLFQKEFVIRWKEENNGNGDDI